MRFKLLLAAAAAVSLSTAADAQTIVNGSFEDGPSTPANGFTTLLNGSTAITGWTVGGDSVDYLNNYFPAQDGNFSVDLSGNNAGSLSQTLTGLSAGRAYQVSFFLSGNAEGPPPSKTLDVSAGGSTQGYTYTPPGGVDGYSPYTFRFTAGGSSEVLSFTSTAATAYGAVLDNVSLSAVPEPATWALMIMGFGAVGGALRRRKVATAAFA